MKQQAGQPIEFLKLWMTPSVTGPGSPLPITLPSIFTTGTISAPVPVRKHSSAL
jgi:hypothetical protein